MKKLLLIITMSFYVQLFAAGLQNNYTLVVSSVSSIENAKTFINRYLSEIEQPIFILKSHRGFHMVTLGSYTSREAAFLALNQLPQNIKDEKPFLSTLDYNLTSNDERILSRYNQLSTPKETKRLQTKVAKTTLPEKKSPIIQKEPTLQKTAMKESNNNYIDSISIAYGQNKSHKNLYRIGVQKNFQESYFESEVGYLSGYYDLALSRLSYDKAIYALSMSPVFKYNFKTDNKITPYLFGGIGATFLSDTSTENKEFSTVFQFEDRIGLGAKMQNSALELGYYHSSNASIKKPNDGMDMVYFSYLKYF